MKGYTCTGMEPYTDSERHLGHVFDGEVTTLRQQVQGHGRYLPSVAIGVPDWKAATHHVGVTDRLHLQSGVHSK